MYWFTLFVHLTTPKILSYGLIIVYNPECQIRLDTLWTLCNSIVDDIKLAVYFHGIKVTYLDFALVHRLIPFTKISFISSLMTILEDHNQNSNNTPAPSIYIKETKRGNGLGRTSNSGKIRSIRSGGQLHTSEIGLYCSYQIH